MKTTNQKQLLIIEEAKKLFFKFGIKKVSVEEICSVCGISKKTFYQNFKNKYELAKVVLKEFSDLDHQQFAEVTKKKISFRDKIIMLTKVKMEKYQSAEAVFFNDIMENCPELQEHVKNELKENEREFFKFVSSEQANNNLRNDLPASFISYLLMNNATRLIFDPEMDKIFPKFDERVFNIVDCLINGIEGDLGSSS